MTQMVVQTIKWKEKISYGLGDTASAFSLGAINLYLLYFYTDVVGIAPAILATLFLIVRIWDAINDPLIGIMVDKTHTKWGKQRPYFLWMAGPYGLITILLFISPNLSMSGKIVWAYCTYILYAIIYTAINLPLACILPSMTEDRHERTKLNAVRMFFGRTGNMIISVALLPMVALLGKGNEAKGFQWTMIIFGVAATVMFLITFANTRERINTGTEKVKFRDGLKAIGKNGPWWVLLAINFILWIGVSIQQATLLYYFKYVIGAQQLATVFMAIGFASTLGGISMAPVITKRMGKRNAFMLGNIVACIGMLGMLVLGTRSLPLLFVFGIFSYFGTGFGTPLVYSMLADTVDYGEYLSGTRAQGLVFSASSFGIKCGMGVGSGLCALILSLGNYVANAEQETSALLAIKWNFLIFPLIIMVLITILLPFYKLDKIYPKIKEELENRK